MNKSRIIQRVLSYEIIGFVGAILLLWLDEIWDLPHALFGAPATPINWMESAMETVFFVVLGAVIAGVTRALLKEVKYLEGFLSVCSFCKRIRVDDTWHPIEEYIRDHSAAEFTHSLCPDCRDKHYGPLLKNKPQTQ